MLLLSRGFAQSFLQPVGVVIGAWPIGKWKMQVTPHWKNTDNFSDITDIFWQKHWWVPVFFAGNFITDRQVTTVLEKHPPGSQSCAPPPFSFWQTDLEKAWPGSTQLHRLLLSSFWSPWTKLFLRYWTSSHCFQWICCSYIIHWQLGTHIFAILCQRPQLCRRGWHPWSVLPDFLSLWRGHSLCQFEIARCPKPLWITFSCPRKKRRLKREPVAHAWWDFRHPVPISAVSATGRCALIYLCGQILRGFLFCWKLARIPQRSPLHEATSDFVCWSEDLNP